MQNCRQRLKEKCRKRKDVRGVAGKQRSRGKYQFKYHIGTDHSDPISSVLVL